MKTNECEGCEKSFHYHKDERDLLVKCYHSCKSIATDWRFWAANTLGFPLEHALWEHVYPFKEISQWLGL